MKIGYSFINESLKKNFHFKKPKNLDELFDIMDVVYEIYRREDGMSAADKIMKQMENCIRISDDKYSSEEWNKLGEYGMTSSRYNSILGILNKITSDQLENIYTSPIPDNEQVRDVIEYDEEIEHPEYRSDDLYDFSSIRR